PENRSAAAVEVVLDRLRVDAGRWDPGPQAVEREDHEREEDALAELGDAPGIGEPGEHLFLLGRGLFGLIVCRRFRYSYGLGLGRLGLGCGRLGLRLRVLLLLDLRLLQERHRSTGLLDLLTRGRRDRVDANGQLLLQVSVPEQLDVGLRVLQQPLLDEALRSDLRTVLEAVERAHVDRSSRRAERADWHRVLGGRTALLAQAHVDRHLAALEAGAHLVRAGPGLLALDPPAGIAALAGALATADTLPVLAGLSGLDRGEGELFSHFRP